MSIINGYLLYVLPNFHVISISFGQKSIYRHTSIFTRDIFLTQSCLVKVSNNFMDLLNVSL
jgi:hypothetical protein